VVLRGVPARAEHDPARGPAPDADADTDTETNTETDTDQDDDGARRRRDDADPDVSPGALDLCDGRDKDHDPTTAGEDHPVFLPALGGATDLETLPDGRRHRWPLDRTAPPSPP
jgi:hypothetical protein